MVVTALLESIGGIFNVAIVVMIIWMMFGILAVNIFGGKFQYCSKDQYLIDNKEECLNSKGNWLTYNQNFDSVPQSMITLFIVASLEGWPDIMYQGIESTEIERGPKKDNTPFAAFFFIIFIWIGSFLFLNLFVGVIFKNYIDAQNEDIASSLLNEK